MINFIDICLEKKITQSRPFLCVFLPDLNLENIELKIEDNLYRTNILMNFVEEHRKQYIQQRIHLVIENLIDIRSRIDVKQN